MLRLARDADVRCADRDQLASSQTCAEKMVGSHFQRTCSSTACHARTRETTVQHRDDASKPSVSVRARPAVAPGRWRGRMQASFDRHATSSIVPRVARGVPRTSRLIAPRVGLTGERVERQGGRRHAERRAYRCPPSKGAIPGSADRREPIEFVSAPSSVEADNASALSAHPHGTSSAPQPMHAPSGGQALASVPRRARGKRRRRRSLHVPVHEPPNTRARQPPPHPGQTRPVRDAMLVDPDRSADRSPLPEHDEFRGARLNPPRCR